MNQEALDRLAEKLGGRPRPGFAEAAMKALGTLTQREQNIIRQRCGFDGPPRTLEEIGHELGVTRERARQLEAKILRKLRRRIMRYVEKTGKVDLDLGVDLDPKV